MIFSLITCPAAAAYQICTGHRQVIFVSMFFGILSSLAGFFVSYYFDLPTGACIVIASAAIFALAAMQKAFLGRRD